MVFFSNLKRASPEEAYEFNGGFYTWSAPSSDEEIAEKETVDLIIKSIKLLSEMQIQYDLKNIDEVEI